MLLQVCKRWRRLLAQPAAQQHLWHEVVVDFGHELITAVHTPMKWSDKRPSDDEFRTAFMGTRLNSSRIITFIEARARFIRSLVFRNSEGYFSGTWHLPSCSLPGMIGPEAQPSQMCTSVPPPSPPGSHVMSRSCCAAWPCRRTWVVPMPCALASLLCCTSRTARSPAVRS